MVEWRRTCFVGEEIVMCMNSCSRNDGRFVGEEMLMCVIFLEEIVMHIPCWMGSCDVQPLLQGKRW